MYTGHGSQLGLFLEDGDDVVTNEPYNRVLRHLEHIDEKIDRLAQTADVSAHLQAQIERLREEVEQIKRRLDIAEG
jgi:uncharacterized protein YceH (UPF0502 family)